MVEHDTTESGTRTVNTFVFLLESAKASLDRANVLAPGDPSHSCLQAIVFSAFALEAYLNHIGPTLYPFWSSLERLGPKEKLAIVCDKLRVTPDTAKRPFQSFALAFKARNLAAHGKTEQIEYEERVAWGLPSSAGPPGTELEELCTIGIADHVVNDVKAIIELLDKASGGNPILLWVRSRVSSVRIPDVEGRPTRP